MKKKTKKKLNFKRTLVFILFLYIVGFSIYLLVNQKIKHIEINGNNLVKDSEILRVSKLKDYPSMLRYSSRSIKKNIQSIELIDTVKVKKWFGSKVIIDIKENKVLFYYKDTDKIVLNNGNIIKNNYNLLGIPILISDLKGDVFNDLVKYYKVLNDNIIYEINSIEYFPLKDENGNIIGDNRFKIIMNDTNTIIVNTKTISVLNKYNDIYASLGGRVGTINIDSDEISNLVFIPYEG